VPSTGHAQSSLRHDEYWLRPGSATAAVLNSSAHVTGAPFYGSMATDAMIQVAV